MAQPPEATKPAETSREHTRDPAEVALSAIAEALALPDEPASDSLSRIIRENAAEEDDVHRRLARAALASHGVSPQRDPVSVNFVYDAGEIPTEASDDEELIEFVKTLRASIDARLGSPDDHLAHIRSELKSVQYVRS